MAPSELMHGLQEAGHGPEHDYVNGSPHLKHPELRDWIVAEVVGAVGATRPAGERPRVLEVGAGHGSLTAQLVDAGADVVVTEMSSHSATVLRERFAGTEAVSVVDDPTGGLEVEGPFDAVVYVSVLHHIPDYLAAVRRAASLLRPDGALVSFQDPLWYPRQSRSSRLVTKAVYYGWRVTQGSLLRGVATTIRQVRGVYDDDNPSDMVEYHVMRQGVDEAALVGELRPHFAEVRLLPYFSTQSTWGQRLGAGRLPVNTFGLVASGRRAVDGPSGP